MKCSIDTLPLFRHGDSRKTWLIPKTSGPENSDNAPPGW